MHQYDGSKSNGKGHETSIVGYKTDNGIQARRYRWPVGISSGPIVDVDDIDFLELAPLYVLAVEVCDAVGRQIRHFDAQMVLALAEHALGYIKDERNGPRTAEILVVQIDARALTYVAEVESPGSVPQVCLRETKVALVDTRTHELRRLLVEPLPSAEAVEGIRALDGRRALDEREAPRTQERKGEGGARGSRSSRKSRGSRASRKSRGSRKSRASRKSRSSRASRPILHPRNENRRLP